MKPKIFILILAATLLVLLSGYQKVSLASEDCDKAKSTVEIKQCQAKEYKKADAELNRVYKKAMAEMDATGKAKLKKAQRAWIAFRDANADLMADAMRGGSAEGILYTGTMITMTERRTKEIRSLLK